MSRRIKNPNEVAAVIDGAEFADLSIKRKHAIASQLAGAPNEFDMVLSHVSSRAETDLERRFIRALVTDAEPEAAPAETAPQPAAAAQPSAPALAVATPEEVAAAQPQN